jgi:benzoyl-CoA reductase/2-hydroxyglutaryl-CoA dehydratase subunit BcrC/BadD/HgdB
MPSIHELFEKLLEADKKIEDAEIECTRKVDSAIMFDKDHCIEIGTNGKSVFNDGFEIVEYDERMFSAEIKIVDGVETVELNRNVNRETIEKLVRENDVDGVISYIQELFNPID